MTPEQLRKIDALVAMHVMGLVLGYMSEQDVALSVVIDQATARFDVIPEYSTDIAAAWSIVELIEPLVMSDTYYWYAGFGVMRDDKGGWQAGHMEGIPYEGESFIADKSASASTAPLAICLAALKSIDIEVPE